MNTYLGVRIS